MIGTDKISNHIKKKCLIVIDSNIFFKEAYEPILIDIFKRISSFGGSVPVYDIQIDEIKSISQEDNSKRAFGARRAFRFIEKMVDDGAIVVKKTNKPAGFHVDEFIIQDLEKNKEKMKILVTDDRELRIKAKSFFEKNNLICVEGSSVFVSPDTITSVKGVVSIVSAGISAGAAVAGGIFLGLFSKR